MTQRDVLSDLILLDSAHGPFLGEDVNGNEKEGRDLLGLGLDAETNRECPLTSLRPSTLQLLSTMLNPVKIIPTPTGLPRDWRGLAELGGLTSETVSYLESRPDPTLELLNKFSTLSYSHIRNIKDLQAFLAVIDRFDVVDDAAPLFESDVDLYSARVANINTENSAQALDPVSERQALTYDDVMSRSEVRTRYDAFILYSDEDSEFADEIVTKMEKDYNLKMCVKDRDVMPGVMFAHEAIGRLIEERCNRLLVIFSPSFLQSPANQFLVSYTQALALELRQRKIIPCMYKRCELPPSVRYSFCLDYNRSGKLWNFWERLRQSLCPVPSPTTASIPIPNSTSAAASASGISLPDSFSWWDAEKQGPTRSRTSHSTSDSGMVTDLDANSDTYSITSHAPLLRVNSGPSNTDLTSSTKTSSKKWYKKITNPIKKKREKDKSKKALTIAE